MLTCGGQPVAVSFVQVSLVEFNYCKMYYIFLFFFKKIVHSEELPLPINELNWMKLLKQKKTIKIKESRA